MLRRIREEESESFVIDLRASMRKWVENGRPSNSKLSTCVYLFGFQIMALGLPLKFAAYLEFKLAVLYLATEKENKENNYYYF